jgi:hypothetical protein
MTLVRLPRKTILTFSFFTLLSAVFWFMQVYRQKFQTVRHIPVKYIEVPDSIVFENKLPQTIDVTVEDAGHALFRYFFTKDNDSLEINVSEIIRQANSKVLQGSMYEQIIKDCLLSSSTVINYDPNRISFIYSALQQKKIPVILDAQIFLAQGYLLSGDIYVIPDSVTAYSGKDILGSLNYAYTVSDTVSNVKSQEPLTFELKPINNVKFTPSKVEVVVPVDKYTQKEITIPITCIGLPSDLNVKFFPSTVRISFITGLSQYNNISADDFSVELDYNDLKNPNETVIPLRITSSPEYVHNLSLSPSEVEYIFEQK